MNTLNVGYLVSGFANNYIRFLATTINNFQGRNSRGMMVDGAHHAGDENTNTGTETSAPNSAKGKGPNAVTNSNTNSARGSNADNNNTKKADADIDLDAIHDPQQIDPKPVDLDDIHAAVTQLTERNTLQNASNVDDNHLHSVDNNINHSPGSKLGTNMGAQYDGQHMNDSPKSSPTSGKNKIPLSRENSIAITMPVYLTGKSTPSANLVHYPVANEVDKRRQRASARTKSPAAQPGSQHEKARKAASQE
jgi:hypothetical protein